MCILWILFCFAFFKLGVRPAPAGPEVPPTSVPLDRFVQPLSAPSSSPSRYMIANFGHSMGAEGGGNMFPGLFICFFLGQGASRTPLLISVLRRGSAIWGCQAWNCPYLRSPPDLSYVLTSALAGCPATARKGRSVLGLPPRRRRHRLLHDARVRHRRSAQIRRGFPAARCWQRVQPAAQPRRRPLGSGRGRLGLVSSQSGQRRRRRIVCQQTRRHHPPFFPRLCQRQQPQ